MDVINRILVFLSMCFSVVVPSFILYFTNDSNYAINNFLPSILKLAVVLGNGVFSIYRPYRTTWLYFLEDLIVLALYRSTFLHPLDMELPISTIPFFWSEIILDMVCLLINVFYLLHYLTMKRRLKSELNEETNNDSPFDFLNAKNVNRKVESQIEEISGDTRFHKAMAFLKKQSFSQGLRIFTMLLCSAVAIIQMIKMGAIKSVYSYASFLPILLELILLPLILVASLLYPKDFKYLYYYTGFVMVMAAFLGNDTDATTPLGYILELFFLGVGFLVTLITEGRTWTGATPDHDRK